MVAIDLEIRNRKSLSAINSNNDNRLYIEGSSHSGETHSQLLSLLKNKKIDLLFIDGDHSYEGVKKDFEIYKSFVSNKGIIAFHDIVPDSFSRTGVKTSSYVGEVPKFWSEIKKDYKYEEFIESKDQDGCGIGVIYFDQT
jgi:predicted O-methyltransferase YrrM